MRIRAGVLSDRGLVRPANEDSFFLRKGLYVVCDGMGGARAGEVASQMACLGLLALDPATAGVTELRTAVVNTNQAIVSRSRTEEHLMGMGTTLTAVVVKADFLILAHVGDSRAYLFRDGHLAQMTDDHSWVGEMVRRGELTPAQAAIHPHRSVITRALGTDVDVDPDIREIPVEVGDRILLCSDGLTGMVSDEQIAEILARRESPRVTAELLVKAALDGGGEDNVTVVVADLLADESGGDGDTEDDQVGDGFLVGPTDRGDSPGSAHKGRRASAAVRERLSRRAAPTLRPVGHKTRVPADVETVEEVAGVSPGERSAADGPADAGDMSSGPEAMPASKESVTPDIVAVVPPVPSTSAETARKALRRPARRKWLFFAIAVVIVLLIAVAAFAFYNSSVYYVGTHDDGTVALFRGLPASILGMELSSVIESAAGVYYATLAPYMQERVDAHGLVSEEEGRAFLEALGKQQ